MGKRNSDNQAERFILEALDGQKRLFLHELRKACNRGNDTIRPALDSLQAKGLVQRTKSGTWCMADGRTLSTVYGRGQANLFPRPWWATKGGLWG